MSKNLTHFCKIHILNDRITPKMIARYVMPLFEMKILDLKPYLTPFKRQSLFKSNIYQKTRQNKNFTQLVCVTASIISSNCRREKLINSKRDSILQFFNSNLNQGLGFWITLSKANYFVPQQELISQLRQALNASKQKIIYERDLTRNAFNMDFSKVKVSQVLEDVVLKKWSSYLHYHFPGKNSKNLSLQQLENSYLQVSILNFYKIKYSKNPERMYEDIKDLDKMLSKFNFIRFFMTSLFGNGVRNQKNCEAFIKKLKWRTSQTEDYLLFLVRNCSWERNCITLQNFIHLYDTEFRVQQKESVKSLKQNN